MATVDVRRDDEGAERGIFAESALVIFRLNAEFLTGECAVYAASMTLPSKRQSRPAARAADVIGGSSRSLPSSSGNIDARSGTAQAIMLIARPLGKEGLCVLRRTVTCLSLLQDAEDRGRQRPWS
jgi:hypothetical protein